MIRIERPRNAPPLPVDWHIPRQRRRDYGPPRLGALGRAALFVVAAMAGSYLVAWWLA